MGDKAKFAKLLKVLLPIWFIAKILIAILILK